MVVRIAVAMVLVIHILSLASAQRKTGDQNKGAEHTRTIIYFGPAQSELDAASGKDFSEALDDFSYYISRADSTFKRLGITTEYNTAELIEVKYGDRQKVIVNRRAQPFGYVFFDGKKKPLVIDYVLTDLDLLDTAKDYFDIK